MTARKSRRGRKVWLVPLVVAGSAILIIFVVGQFTPDLNARLIRQASMLQPKSRGPNFGAVEGNVTVVPNIVYSHEIDDSVMDVYYPRNATGSLPVIVLIHGGGFVLGDKEDTKEYGMRLANAEYVVANINYALAPEHKYPDPVIQTNLALMYLNDNAGKYGGDMNRLFIGGNSAGAQISSQMAAIASNKKLADSMGITPSVKNSQLRGVLLFSGPYDMRTFRATGFPSVDTLLWAYTGVRDFENYPRIDELSTVRQVTPDYPPVFVAAGDADPLEPQSIELIKALQNNGVEVDPVLFNDTNANLGHDYQFKLDTSYAQQTLAKAIEFLKTHS